MHAADVEVLHYVTGQNVVTQGRKSSACRSEDIRVSGYRSGGSDGRAVVDGVDLNEGVAAADGARRAADDYIDVYADSRRAEHLDVTDRDAIRNVAGSLACEEADRAVVARIDMALRRGACDCGRLSRDGADLGIRAGGDHGHVAEVHTRQAAGDLTEEADLDAAACDHEVAEQVTRTDVAAVQLGDDGVVVDHVGAVRRAADVRGLRVGDAGGAPTVQGRAFRFHRSETRPGSDAEVVSVVAVCQSQGGDHHLLIGDQVVIVAQRSGDGAVRAVDVVPGERGAVRRLLGGKGRHRDGVVVACGEEGRDICDHCRDLLRSCRPVGDACVRVDHLERRACVRREGGRDPAVLRPALHHVAKGDLDVTAVDDPRLIRIATCQDVVCGGHVCFLLHNVEASYASGHRSVCVNVCCRCPDGSVVRVLGKDGFGRGGGNRTFRILIVRGGLKLHALLRTVVGVLRYRTDHIGQGASVKLLPITDHIERRDLQGALEHQIVVVCRTQRCGDDIGCHRGIVPQNVTRGVAAGLLTKRSDRVAFRHDIAVRRHEFVVSVAGAAGSQAVAEAVVHDLQSGQRDAGDGCLGDEQIAHREDVPVVVRAFLNDGKHLVRNDGAVFHEDVFGRAAVGRSAVGVSGERIVLGVGV